MKNSKKIYSFQIDYYHETPPPIPRETCPILDNILGNIEKVRDANADLRHNAEYYQAETERLEEELKEAKQEIENLEEELEIYRQEEKQRLTILK